MFALDIPDLEDKMHEVKGHFIFVFMGGTYTHDDRDEMTLVKLNGMFRFVCFSWKISTRLPFTPKWVV